MNELKYLRILSVAIVLALAAACGAETAADVSAKLGEVAGSGAGSNEVSSGEPSDSNAPRVADVVAVFDSYSSVQNQRIEAFISRELAIATNECLLDEGAEPLTLSPMPGIDDPIWQANKNFPDIEALELNGFIEVPGTPAKPEDFVGNSAERDAQLARCQAVATQNRADMTQALELWQNLTAAWWPTLEELENNEALLDLTESFSACLVSEGIPAESSEHEGRFLGYLDSVIRSNDDPIARTDIRREMGQLYAHCGRDLFEARVELRLPHREAFLDAHQDEIAELDSLLRAFPLN